MGRAFVVNTKPKHDTTMNRDNMTTTEKLTELHTRLFKALMALLAKAGIEVGEIEYFNEKTKTPMKIHLAGKAKGVWLNVRCESYGIEAKGVVIPKGKGHLLAEVGMVLARMKK